jgi:hypothetical protein
LVGELTTLPMTVMSVPFTVLLEAAAPEGAAGALPACSDPAVVRVDGGRAASDLWTTASAVDDAGRPGPRSAKLHVGPKDSYRPFGSESTLFSVRPSGNGPADPDLGVVMSFFRRTANGDKDGDTTSFWRLGGRSWSQEIEASAAMLRIRRQTILTREPPAGYSMDERDVICAGAEELVSAALAAARGKLPQYRTLRSWWRGTSVEAAFRRIHEAESELVRLYSDEEVLAEIPAAIGRAEVSLNRDDPMRQAARLLSSNLPAPNKRALLSKVVQVGHEAADGSHSRIRNFRNILLSTTVCITVLVAVFCVLVAIHPTAVPFCFHPSGPTTVACPSGQGPGRQPTALDVVIVALLGLLGGSLAAAISVRNVRGTETPYDIPIALAVLKVPSGALTAIGALIAIHGAFVPGLSQLDSQEQILAYALVFGYAQQLLTRLIDRQAHDLLDSVPSKDREQNRPLIPAVPGSPGGLPAVTPPAGTVPPVPPPAAPAASEASAPAGATIHA